MAQLRPTRALDALLTEVRACTVCAASLPLGPRPVLRAAATARMLIVGQAPGTKVHASGVPWDDPSGARLRAWLELDDAAFYDERWVAIMPMGLCYPGKQPGGGDHPPRPECAPRWHARVRALLPKVELTLLVGAHAQAYYLPELARITMTARVRAAAGAERGMFALPHPSWRVQGWMKRNPWFESEVLPVLREKVRGLRPREVRAEN
jgi:uracil-DNA glycosylase